MHRARGAREPKTLDVEETLELTISDGKIQRIDESTADQAAEDASWS